MTLSAFSDIDSIILKNLLKEEAYGRKTLPFLKKEYFQRFEHKIIFETIVQYYDQYNSPPSVEAVIISIDGRDDIQDQTFEYIIEIVKALDNDDSVQKEEWLIDQTEKFCKDMAIHNAIIKSVDIIQGNDKKHGRDAIPELMKDALSVGFNASVGHDYNDEYMERYKYYTQNLKKIPFDLSWLNKITENGITYKTLNLLMGPTGCGKTHVLTHLGQSYARMGLNVVYITMEMSDIEIGKRIDANMLDVPLSEIRKLNKEDYEDRFRVLLSRQMGKLVIQEYPTGAAHAGHFRHFLNELRLKKNIDPDIIIVDYLGICASQRYGYGNHGTYTIQKSVAEEVRSLGVEFDAGVWSAIQTNRGGYDNNDFDLGDTSDSIGVPMSADMILALIRDDALDQMGHIMIKQLKNRYSDPSRNKRFIIGADRLKMRLYDVPDSFQRNLIGNDVSEEENDDVPLFDKSHTAKKIDYDKFKF